MSNTREECQTTGVYRSGCGCQTELALSKGEAFPPCPRCHKAVNWAKWPAGFPTKQAPHSAKEKPGPDRV